MGCGQSSELLASCLLSALPRGTRTEGGLRWQRMVLWVTVRVEVAFPSIGEPASHWNQKSLEMSICCCFLTYQKRKCLGQIQVYKADVTFHWLAWMGRRFFD